jgi:hypothetical protein
MRNIVASLLVIGSFTLPMPTSGQARAGAPPGTSGTGACSLLSRELIEKVLGRSVNPILLNFPPTEAPIGKFGSSCAYGGVTLQIDFLTTQALEDMRRKVGNDWEAVAGVGDAAYFRNNQNLFGEVLGRTGSRTFSVLMGLQKTPIDTVKTNVIALARQIVPQMR